MLRSLYTAFALVAFGAGAAWGAPVPAKPETRLPILRVANGCGPGYFRTIAGDCRPNLRLYAGPRRGVVAPPPCPRGFRRDPDPARPICYPIY